MDREIENRNTDTAPGDEHQDARHGIWNYVIGFLLAAGLTATSFWVTQSSMFWPPGVTLGIAVLGIAQMGIHLVFFLHITTGPDNANNALALAFGVLIVTLFVAGSLWIMTSLDMRMMPAPPSMTDLHMQR